MTPHRHTVLYSQHTILCSSTQQLLRLHFRPSKGSLSRHGALQGPSTRLVCCFQNYKETRPPKGALDAEVPGNCRKQRTTHLFTPILDCEKSPEWNWVIDQTWPSSGGQHHTVHNLDSTGHPNTRVMRKPSRPRLKRGSSFDDIEEYLTVYDQEPRKRYPPSWKNHLASYYVSLISFHFSGFSK